MSRFFYTRGYRETAQAEPLWVGKKEEKTILEEKGGGQRDRELVDRRSLLRGRPALGK